ncbi:MAG: CPBP family intramembrane metalloprotease [Planctomycetota bacterium]|nr:CPBP family intramembrane metalloprotease [Planctomycetota bacterium]MDA1211964.1 CPBP family intramembrane metalloprotease [Planctomycetota bacterium]
MSTVLPTKSRSKSFAGSRADVFLDEYWAISRRPWPSLLFLIPLLIAYEVGIWRAGARQAETLRNGADAWLRGLLSHFRLEEFWLLPAFIVLGLLVWHFSNQDKWKVSPSTFAGMLAESLLFAFFLILCGQILVFIFQKISGTDPVLTSIPQMMIPSRANRIVSYIGAGIYEETLFRLCLIPLCYGMLNSVFRSHRVAIVGAILISSSVFMGAHYLSGAEQLTGFNAMFRLFAGMYFSVLFLYRGFGITVGCHAVYDVIVGVLWW